MAAGNQVIGRMFWDDKHPSPWVSFPNRTAYTRWARDVRKALPGTKTEYAYCDWVHTADSLLAAAQAAAVPDPPAVAQADYVREYAEDPDILPGA